MTLVAKSAAARDDSGIGAASAVAARRAARIVTDFENILPW